MRLQRSQILLLTAVVWIVFGLICGTQIWLSMLDHGHNVPLILFYQALVWTLWIPFTFGIVALVRRVPLVPFSPRNALAHVLVVPPLALVHVAWWVSLEFILIPYDRMNPTHFGRRFFWVGVGQFPLELLLYFLVAMTAYAIDTYAQVRERELRAAQLEKSLAEARLHALELQIQPHFLFNTLNTISSLVRVGQTREAVAMIGGLSDLLRYALDRAGDQRVALDDEIAMLRRYFEIQQLRFEDRLSFEIDVAAGSGRAAVPVLILQPLAENAIRHGIATVDAPGRVRVRAERHDGALRIEVTNTGRLPSRIDRGIGLSNTHARLEQLYGSAQTFELIEHEGVVTARIILPWSEAT
jgi:two-component system, LytTR family, sensor kinase